MVCERIVLVDELFDLQTVQAVRLQPLDGRRIVLGQTVGLAIDIDGGDQNEVPHRCGLQTIQQAADVPPVLLRLPVRDPFHRGYPGTDEAVELPSLNRLDIARIVCRVEIALAVSSVPPTKPVSPISALLAMGMRRRK